MKLIQTIKELPVTSKAGVRYHGITFDGCNFILTASCGCDRYICRFTACMELICCKQTCTGYSSICYDPCLCCFWACPETGCRKLYRLDTDFCDVDFLSISTSGKFCGGLNGVALGPTSDTLVVSFADGAAEICKCDGTLKAALSTHTASITSSIAASCDFFSCIYKRDCCAFIGLSWYDGLSSLKLCLEEDCFPQDLSCYPTTCNHGCDSGSSDASSPVCLYMLYNKKGCYPHVLVLLVTDSEASGLPCQGLPCQGLPCQGLPCQGLPCPPNPPCPPCPPYPPCPPHPPKPSPSEACTDVLESVALVEAALSHILNAEGEKIQRAVADCDTVDELLHVNDSVSRTVRHATYLEQLMVAKLELVQDICRQQKPPKPPKPPHDCDECHDIPDCSDR